MGDIVLPSETEPILEPKVFEVKSCKVTPIKPSIEISEDELELYSNEEFDLVESGVEGNSNKIVLISGEKKRKRVPRVLGFDIKEVLNNHPLGPALFMISKYKQEFDSYAQSVLVEIVITNLFSHYGRQEFS